MLFAEESLFLFYKLKPQRDSSAKGMPRNDSNFYFFLKLVNLWGSFLDGPKSAG